MSSQLKLLDLDIQKRVLANFDWEKHWRAYGYFETEGFVRLVEAITRGDKSLADQVLRRWGI